MIIVTALFSILLPVGLLIYWRKKTGLSIIPFAVGAVCFLMFAMVLEQALHSVCLVADNPVSRTIKSSPFLYVLYGCLAAGVFEETGRLFGYKFLLPKQKAKENAIAYGIGHGGIEVLMTLGLTYIMLTLVQFGVNLGEESANEMFMEAIRTTSSATMLLAMLERVAAMMLQIGLSILVFIAANRPGKKIFYPMAIILHAMANVPAAMYQIGILKSLPAVELPILLVSAAVFAFSIYLYRRLDTE